MEVVKEAEKTASESIPTTEREFRTWRLRQTFATPEIEARAKLVENDLRILSGPSGRIPRMRELAAQNVREFAAMLAAS